MVLYAYYLGRMDLPHSFVRNYERMYLFFDTETTGLPRKWDAPSSDTRNWPRLVQLACLLYDEEGLLQDSQNFIIRPAGFTIPSSASRIHRITTERALEEGQPLADVLAQFSGLLGQAKCLVAHNMAFDEKVLGAEFFRVHKQDPLREIGKVCTMKTPSIIAYCQVPPKRYGTYKWPRLDELYRKLFERSFEEAHDAAVDVRATAECFWELRNRQVL